MPTPALGRRRRRGVAMLVTVMLASVAAAIAFAIVRAASNEAQTGGNRLSTDASLRDAQGVLGQAESQLIADPLAPLTAVLEGERARVCATDVSTTKQPGEAWPEACRSWTYTEPTVADSTRFELTTPTPANSKLSVTALSRHGGIDAGYETQYVLAGGGKWVWASIGDLDLSTSSPSQSVTIEGSAYAVGDVGVGTAVSLEDAVVATEASYSSSPTDLTTRWFGGAVSDVRAVQPNPARYGTLAAAVEVAREVACPGGDPSNLATSSYISHLCFTAGSAIPKLDGTLASTPAGTASYLLLVGDGVVQVYATTQTIDTSAESNLVCSDCRLPALAGELMASGTHPGQLDWWTQSGGVLLGQFRLPSSGVMAFDGDVSIGVCSDAGSQYANSQPCAQLLNAGQPGIEARASLTIVAGTTSAPKDVIIGSPLIAASGVDVGIIASDQIIFPYWSRPAGQNLQVDAHLLAGGLEDATRASVAAFPTTLAYSGVNDENWAQSLVVNGSLTGVQLPVGQTGFRTVEYRPSASVIDGAAPWFAGLDATWVKVGTSRVSGFDVCGSRACGGDGTGAASPGYGAPLPPSGVVCVPATTEALCSWTPVESSPDRPVTGYRILIGDVERWSGTSTSAVVPNLTPGTQYQVVVVAIGPGGEAASGPVDVLTLPACPTLSATPQQYSDTVMELSWAGVQSATTYRVFIDEDVAPSATVSGTSTTDTTGTANLLRSYRLEAENASGTSVGCAAVSARFGPGTPVLNPIVRTGTAYSGSFAGGAGAATWVFQVERTSEGTLISTGSSSDGTMAGDEGTPNTRYRYRAHATNSAGSSGPWSPWSSWSDGIEPACPTTSATLDATNPHTTVNISWSAVATATSYRVYRNGVLKTDTASLSYTDTSGSPDSTYGYVVKAVGAAESAGCAVSTIRFGPGAPTISPIAVTNTTLSGTFSGGVGVASKWQYRIEKDTAGNVITSSVQSGVTVNYEEVLVGSFSKTGVNSARYRYQVRAVNSDRQAGPWSEWSAWSGFTSPTCPSWTASITGGAVGEAVLSWTAVTGADGYKVYKGTPLSLLGSTATTSYAHTGGAANTTESFTVTATNAAGESGPCSSSPVTFGPGTPTVPKPAVTGTTVSATWSGGAGASTWNLELRRVGGSTVLLRNDGTNSFSLSEPAYGAKYEYRAQAKNAAGTSSWSAWSPTSECTVTNAPTAGTPTALNPTSISFPWTIPTACPESISSYRVDYRLKGTTTWSSLTVTAPAVKADFTVPNAGTYEMWVRATNSAGLSDWSALVEVATITVPGKPGTPTAARVASQTIRLAWTAPLSNGGSAINDYDVEYSTIPGFAAGTGTFAELGTSSATTIDVGPATGVALVDGTTYYFRVSAQNSATQSSVPNRGSWSDSSTGAKPYTTPAAPNCSVGTITTTSIVLNWTAGFDGGSSLTSYEMEHKLTAAANWTASGSLSNAAVSRTASTLTPGSQYSLRVRAVNAAGTGSWCTVNSYTIADAPSFSSFTNTTTSITVNWTAVANADYYEVQRNGANSTLPTTVSRTDSSLAVCTTYSFTVRAHGPWGYSAWSGAYQPRTECQFTYTYQPLYADLWADQASRAGVDEINLGFSKVGYGDWGFNPARSPGNWHYITGIGFNSATMVSNLSGGTVTACNLTTIMSRTWYNYATYRYQMHFSPYQNMTSAEQQRMGLPNDSPSWIGSVNSPQVANDLATGISVSTLALGNTNCAGFQTGAYKGLLYGPNNFVHTSSNGTTDNALVNAGSGTPDFVAFTGAALVDPANIYRPLLEITINN